MNPLLTLALELVEPLVRSVLPNSAAADEVMAKVRLRALDVDETEIKAKQSVLLAEIQSEDKLTRSWRPHMMYLMGAVIAFTLLVVPLFNTFFFPALAFLLNLVLPTEHAIGELKFEVVTVPTEVWTILQVSIPGYIGMRGVEKVAATLSQRSTDQGPRAGRTVVDRILRRKAPPAPPKRTYQEHPVERKPLPLDYDLAELPMEDGD